MSRCGLRNTAPKSGVSLKQTSTYEVSSAWTLKCLWLFWMVVLRLPSQRGVTWWVVQMRKTAHSFRQLLPEDIHDVALIEKGEVGRNGQSSNPFLLASTHLANHCVKWAWRSDYLFEKTKKKSGVEGGVSGAVGQSYEHFGSSILKPLLCTLIHRLRKERGGPQVILAPGTPAG